MRTILSIFLTAILLFPLFQKVWIIIDYKINQDYIAAFLCVDRAKPVSMCYGKCQLSKRLSAAEQDEKKDLPARLKEKPENIYHSCFDNLLLNEAALNIRQLAFITNSDFIKIQFLNGIFRPPELYT